MKKSSEWNEGIELNGNINLTHIRIDWSPNLVMSKKIETMDMETGFIEEEFQEDD